ncbi:MAG: hypothetical protein ACI9FG_001388 [Crocinitomicaceae bacterium]|jgi:hypothetical protein
MTAWYKQGDQQGEMKTKMAWQTPFELEESSDEVGHTKAREKMFYGLLVLFFEDTGARGL